MNDLKHCASCRFHALLAGVIHACTLPPDCAPTLREEDADGARPEIDLATYAGTSCDVMRRMGALCGPRGNLWSPVDAR